MDDNTLYRAEFRTKELQSHIARATCYDGGFARDYRVEVVEKCFITLAAALGYEVAKIVTPADEAA